VQSTHTAQHTPIRTATGSPARPPHSSHARAAAARVLRRLARQTRALDAFHASYGGGPAGAEALSSAGTHPPAAARVSPGGM